MSSYQSNLDLHIKRSPWRHLSEITFHVHDFNRPYISCLYKRCLCKTIGHSDMFISDVSHGSVEVTVLDSNYGKICLILPDFSY